MNYEKPTSFNKWDIKDLKITKQAIVKSLIEAGVITKRTPEAEKMIEEWIAYVYRLDAKDFALMGHKDDKEAREFLNDK